MSFKFGLPNYQIKKGRTTKPAMKSLVIVCNKDRYVAVNDAIIITSLNYQSGVLSECRYTVCYVMPFTNYDSYFKLIFILLS